MFQLGGFSGAADTDAIVAAAAATKATGIAAAAAAAAASVAALAFSLCDIGLTTGGVTCRCLSCPPRLSRRPLGSASLPAVHGT